jgi:hypothetical protein
MSSTKSRPRRESPPPNNTPTESPRVVYLQAPVTLARLVAREGDRWRATVGGAEVTLGRDPSVDPALLDEALAQGARVLVEGAPPEIVGVLQVARSVRVDREGDVDLRVRRFVVTAAEEALVRTAKAFVQLRDDEAEVFGRRVVVRAREIARVLGRMVQLN